MTEQALLPGAPQFDFEEPSNLDFDPAQNPEAANFLGQLAMTGKVPGEQPTVPLVPDVPDGMVTLKAGYLNADGDLLLDAEVRELTGADEEAMAKADATGNLTRFVDVIIERGTVSIGGEPASKRMLDSLLIGDRDLLALAIRKVTYGRTMRLPLICPKCKDNFDVDYDLDADIPIKDYAHGSSRVLTVELTKGRQAVAAQFTGSIQKAVHNSEAIKLNGAEINTLLLGQCLLQYNNGRTGLTPVRDAAHLARTMGLRDRHRLLSALVEAQPGPKYEDVKQDCPNCEESFPLVIDYSVLFRPED